MSQENNWQQQVWQQPTQPHPSQPQPSQPQPQPAYAPNAYAPAATTYQPVAFQQQPKKSRAWIVALVAVILLFVLMFAGLASCNNMMSSTFGSLGSLGASSSSSSSVDYLTEDAVAVITLDGTIQYDGTTCSPEGLKSQLDRAAENSHIKAVVLRVNSGGGTATAGEEMAVYVREFAESTGKPVVVSSASVNASAAYEVSSQARYIFTAKTTAIGAIGTVMQTTDLSGLLEKLGISVDNIASADSKDSSYGTRPLTEEERAYYQAQVDQINATFVQTVAEGRGMSIEEVSALATGMTFTGIEAVNNGLADDLGTLEDAQAKAAELAGISSYTTVSLEPDYYYDLSSLLGLMSLSSSDEKVAALLEELEQDGTLTN